jgi:hypothetical protein
LYLFSVVEFMQMFIFLFKPSFCNGPETELKCKIGFRTYIVFAFYHIQTVGAYSLLALMYPATVHIMCVSVLAKRIPNSLIYRLLNDVGLCRMDWKWGTQQEYSYMRHAVTNRIPVAANLVRVNEACVGMFDQGLRMNEVCSTAKRFVRRKWVSA